MYAGRAGCRTLGLCILLGFMSLSLCIEGVARGFGPVITGLELLVGLGFPVMVG